MSSAFVFTFRSSGRQVVLFSTDGHSLRYYRERERCRHQALRDPWDDFQVFTNDSHATPAFSVITSQVRNQGRHRTNKKRQTVSSILQVLHKLSYTSIFQFPPVLPLPIPSLDCHLFL